MPGPATVNQAYMEPIAATGGVGPTYTWTLNGSTTVPTSGSVPLGSGSLSSQFSISDSGGGSSVTIAGTPTATGTVTFSLAVKDNTTGLSSSTVTYTLTVSPVSTLVITINNNPQGMVNMPYTFGNLNVDGGVGPYTVTYTNAPAGITQPSGTWNLVGTPTSSGQTTVTIKVTDSTTPVPQQQSTTFTLSVVPETVATNNSEIKGQYACYFEQFWPGGVVGGGGTGATVYRGGIVFAFTADGNGNITGGEMDSNSPSQGYTTGSGLTGTYAVGSDNRGYMTGGVPLAAISGGDLNSSGQFSEFALVRMDDAGASPSTHSGAGHCYQQNTTTSLSGITLSGGYVFGMTGEDGDGNIQTVIGSTQFSGATLTFVQDIVDAGTYEGDMTGSGTVTSAPDAYGRMTISFSVPGIAAAPMVMYITNNAVGETVAMAAISRTASNGTYFIGEMRAQNAAHVAAAYPLNGPFVMYETALRATWQTISPYWGKVPEAPAPQQ